ncbi:UbiH/UbiF family hydroxylase [Lentilitoribacter sp. EG35]|uniref:UbiH/UbiF family hydroxylase n=1 Tax=Lentilitoribacter sp. EG35 TaxID=3234192 RepID=UPI0034603C6A
MERDLQFEVLVVGGGLAGLSAAIAAHLAGFKTAVIAKKSDTDDERTTALFMPSIDFLDKIGIWQQIETKTEALQTMRILDGTKRIIRSPPASFHANEIELDQFGFNIPNQVLLDALFAKLDELKITRFDEFATDYVDKDDIATVSLTNGDVLKAGHVIAADGRRSLIREKVGIKHRAWQYHQKAIVLSFKHSLSHQNISTEFHTEKGPFTQVPLPGKRSSLVWAIKPEEEAEILGRPLDELNQMVEQNLHSTLGAVEIDTTPQCYPLSSLLANKFGRGRVMLVGEAGHAFPPIGAQGLNLGLRDVITAIECISVNDTEHSAGVGEAYHRARQLDVITRTFGIDMFNRTLLTSFLPVQLVRSGVISAASNVSFLKQLVMRQGAQVKKHTDKIAS